MKKIIWVLIAFLSLGIMGCYNHSTPQPGKVIAPEGKFYVGAIAGKIS